jgi:hypothetical protein
MEAKRNEAQRLSLIGSFATEMRMRMIGAIHSMGSIAPQNNA